MNVFKETAIGFGTFDLPENGAEIVLTALETGYRHIDTAQNYDTEADVGSGIERSAVSRDEIFLATKVGSSRLAYEDVLASTERCLDRLGTDYIDLLYVHWPIKTYEPEETLAAFDELYDAGTVRHIGVSNFATDQLDKARELLDAPIFAHQIECHPLLPQAELRRYADRHDHQIVSYSPLAGGAIFDRDIPEIRAVADKHNASVSQVTLAWHLSKGITPIPKAAGDHVRENWEATEYPLEREDIQKIDGIERRERTIDIEEAPWNR